MLDLSLEAIDLYAEGWGSGLWFQWLRPEENKTLFCVGYHRVLVGGVHAVAWAKLNVRVAAETIGAPGRAFPRFVCTQGEVGYVRVETPEGTTRRPATTGQ